MVALTNHSCLLMWLRWPMRIVSFGVLLRYLGLENILIEQRSCTDQLQLSRCGHVAVLTYKNLFFPEHHPESFRIYFHWSFGCAAQMWSCVCAGQWESLLCCGMLSWRQSSYWRIRFLLWSVVPWTSYSCGCADQWESSFLLEGWRLRKRFWLVSCPGVVMCLQCPMRISSEPPSFTTS